MKIGVGVITMGVRALKDYKTAPDTYFHVHTDTDRKGVSHARNSCLKHLYDQGCDYMFVFDDDCYPVVGGWENYFVKCHEQSGLNFFILPEAFKDTALSLDEHEIIRWTGGLCQFAFYTRKLVEEVGYYNNSYDRYGYEDAGYMHRVWHSGLNGRASGHPSPFRVLAYIHSEDVYGENPESNISHEDKQVYIQKNYPIYQEEIRSDRIYYPYDN